MKAVACGGAILFLSSLSCASLVGKWQGIALLGPSKIAQTLDTDGLLKLQVSKAFLKSLRYSIELKGDGTFVSEVVGADVERRKSFGNWKQDGMLLTLTTANENGAKVKRTITASVALDKKRFLIIVPSKQGLPVTKLVFTPAPVAPAKPVEPKKPARA